jgi:hypothetical protein
MKKEVTKNQAKFLQKENIKKEIMKRMQKYQMMQEITQKFQ